MKDDIRNHINDPRELEKMYRANRQPFKRAFTQLYPELKGNAHADCWNERLHYETEDINWGTGRELMFVIIAALVAGFIAKIPAIFHVNENFFYPRNLGFIFLPLLTAYFAWKNNLQPKAIALIAGVMLLSLVYINMLPLPANSDTLILACIHLPLLLWVMLGVAFTGNNIGDHFKRLDFLKFNGDLVVMTGLIMIAAAIMTAITIGLFNLIGINIEKFYFENIVIFGLPAAPIVGTYLTRTNPQLVGKVSPVIARIFSPLVLVMLVIYLIAIVYSGKDPYNDRQFLIFFNALLIGVMAIIFFSVAESSRTDKSRIEIWMLLLLSVVTIIVNLIALSAIVFRISEWGLTPNRAAILGGNLLILINLVLVTVQLFKVLFKDAGVAGVGKVIAAYLPVYAVWVVVVVFGFPVVFY